MQAWRIFKTRYAAEAFKGEGARLYGGRWNSVGVAMIYASGSLSLATLELLVHLDKTTVLSSYSTCMVEFDRSLVRSLDVKELPPDWQESPSPHSIQQIGDEWISNASSLILKVPSAVVPQENNYLINPAHKDFKKLKRGKIEALKFDSRLFVA
ncbi:MAG TPA: RES family NAD+ phosphorylase [Pyrinomonadaceae bacterium]